MWLCEKKVKCEMEEVKEYLNNVLSTKELKYGGPKYLYKYRPFDKYTFDMLENNYVFLCKAANLDDKSECDVSIDISSLVDNDKNVLTKECINQILEIVRPYTTEENFNKAKNIILACENKNGTIKSNKLLERYFELQELFPDKDISPFINFLVDLPKQMENLMNNRNVENLIRLAVAAKQSIGVCSLSDSPNIEKQWKQYANNELGYCIEYDVNDYKLNSNLFPVFYEDNRKNNIIIVVVTLLINSFVRVISANQIKTDITQYLRLFLTKNTEWNYQKEWRLLGDANSKKIAPKIKTIYLGKEVSVENAKKMEEYCLKNDIKLINRKDT